MHLFVFEDGSLGQSASEPTSADLRTSVAQGVLDVVVFEHGSFWMIDECGSRVRIPETVRETYEGMEFTVPK